LGSNYCPGIKIKLAQKTTLRVAHTVRNSYDSLMRLLCFAQRFYLSNFVNPLTPPPRSGFKKRFLESSKRQYVL
jgi:hypothetical protein